MKSLIQTRVPIYELEKWNKNTLFNNSINKNSLLSGFLTFDLKKDLEILNRLIMQEYTKNIFYGDFDKCLMYNINDYEPIAYLVARLMYILNLCGQKYHNYCNENKTEFLKVLK